VATTVEGARGGFDPVFFTNVSGQETVSPSTSAYDRAIGVEDYDRDRFAVSTGFTGMLLTGATYTVSMNINRTYDPASGAFLAHNPLVYNNVGIELKQPLLYGGWTTYARSEMIKASLNSESEFLTMKTSLNDIVYQTIEAYWNLVFAVEDLEAKKESLSLAKDLLRINTRKKEEGVFSKMEVLEAKSEVAFKKEQLLTAQTAVKSAEDTLKHLIFRFQDQSEWLISIVPLTEAEKVKKSDYDMDEMLLASLKSRPEYERLDVELKNRDLDLTKSRNELMPKLDLVGNWRYDAIGGNYSNSFDDIKDRKYRFFSTGVEFSYPLGNRTASAAVRRAEIEYKRTHTSMTEMRIQIVREIRDAIRDVILQKERIIASRESMSLARERYEGEKTRLEAGISIPYQVREAERNLHTETVTNIRAILDYQIALAKIQKVQGLLMKKYNIHLAKRNYLE